MTPDAAFPTYHVLLIGIDAYPFGFNSLSGCVNDIDAIEQTLLDPPGIGIPPEQIRITRLAASKPNRPSSSRFHAQTLPPTKANLVQSLKALAGPEVQAEDRVLIYYSGHGDEKLLPGSPVWREALVPHDGQRIDYLYDNEINALINAISRRTSDLTIVLDCCHSAGATRDLSDVSAEGADRHLAGGPTPSETPDLAALGLPDEPSATTTGGAPMLQSLDPNYVVIVACQPNEKAGEGLYPGEAKAHGIMTYSLLNLLRDKNAGERAVLRWADLWPALLDKVSARCTQLGRRPQLPWYIGRTERRIFGGPWEQQDVGYRVTRLPDGRYRVGAGTLMGLNRGAEIAVYGPTPALFPDVNSPENKPVGRLMVVEAEQATCTADPIRAAFDLPQGARGRLVKAGLNERLRVAVKPENTVVPDELRRSSLLDIVPASTPGADVEVIAQPDGSWTIGGEVEPLLARVPPGETFALWAGLDWYYQYQAVLNLARNCNDPQLSRSLGVRLLDCSDKAALQAMSQAQLADPNLPEVGRDAQGIYFVKPGSRSCVKISNTSSHNLKVTLLNCSAGGLVEYMGEATLRAGASHVMWSRSELGRGFPASPDQLPAPPDGVPASPFVTDRLIAIGTTRHEIDLTNLRVRKTVQQVVDENLGRSLSRSLAEEDAERGSNSPAELWTGTITPVRIARE